MSSTPSDAPSEAVTVVFSAFGGARTGCVPFQYTGGPLKQYLKQAAVRQYGLVKKAAYGGARNREGKKVRLTYIPAPGDVVVVG
jgi:hypothetical protein